MVKRKTERKKRVVKKKKPLVKKTQRRRKGITDELKLLMNSAKKVLEKNNEKADQQFAEDLKNLDNMNEELEKHRIKHDEERKKIITSYINNIKNNYRHGKKQHKMT